MKKLHEPGEYRSTVDGKPVKDAVLEMEGGNSFVAVEGAVVPLSVKEASYYLQVQRVIGVAAKGAAVDGATKGLSRATALLLVGVALRATAATVEMVQRMPPTPPPAKSPKPGEEG